MLRAITKLPSKARETGGQFVGEGVGEVNLRRIAAEIGEGQHDHRKPRGLGRRFRGDAVAGRFALRNHHTPPASHDEQRRERGGERGQVRDASLAKRPL